MIRSAGNAFVLALLAGAATGRSYEDGDRVDLWVGKVGPHRNPHEVYAYYSLPFCPPRNAPDAESGAKADDPKPRPTLGERLGGHALRHSGVDPVFGRRDGLGVAPYPPAVVYECATPPLDESEAAAFARAAEDRWFFGMYLDDLPVYGMVGEVLPADAENERRALVVVDGSGRDRDGRGGAAKPPLAPFVYTRRELRIGYIDGEIVKVDLTSDPRSLRRVAPNRTYTFRLVVKWAMSEGRYSRRFDRYIDWAFNWHPFNFFAPAATLLATVLALLFLVRMLRSDFHQYDEWLDNTDTAKEGGEEGKALVSVTIPSDDDKTTPLLSGAGARGDGDGAGEGVNLPSAASAAWARLDPTEFPQPPLLPFLAALLGAGCQLYVVALGTILWGMVRPVHEGRGEAMAAMLVGYGATSFVSGYASTRTFRHYFLGLSGGPTKYCLMLVLLTIFLHPAIMFSVFAAVSAVSRKYGTIGVATLPVVNEALNFWCCLSVQLCNLGSSIGDKSSQIGEARNIGGMVMAKRPPVRAGGSVPSLEASATVHRLSKRAVLVPAAGLLVFGSMFHALCLIMSAIWQHKFFCAYGQLLAMFCVATAFVAVLSILVVYSSLCQGRSKWHWLAFSPGALSGALTFLYAAYYYFGGTVGMGHGMPAGWKSGMTGMPQVAIYFGYMFLISLNVGIMWGAVGHYASGRSVRAIYRELGARGKKDSPRRDGWILQMVR